MTKIPQWQTDLWDAVNAYAATVRGEPDKHVYGNVTRMQAVVVVEGVVRKAVAAARVEERRICAAYVLDRADQYETRSPCWHGLADAAHGIMSGEAAAAEAHGEFDEGLYKRVDSFKGKAPKVRPVDGIES